ncbi:MAG: DNA internalization-related competence protein ComEC/Rec2 [Pseudomonadota bacterium]
MAIICISAAVFLRSRPTQAASVAAVLLAVFFIGFALANAAAGRASDVSVPLGEKTLFTCDGKVGGVPQIKEWGASVDVDLISCGAAGTADAKARGTVRLSATAEDADLLPGERVRFTARFYAPREYHNPGGFSYRRYLMVHGVGAMGRTFGAMERQRGASRFFGWIEALRRQIADSAAANIDGPARGVVIALANGDQNAIDRKLRDAFANTGLAHLLAISGMNVGYVAAFIYLLSRIFFGRFSWLILRVPVKRLAAIVTLPSVWAYVLITGSPISAIRAAIMLTVFLAGELVGLRQDLLSTLGASVVAICAIMPLSILDVSFQLSVVAVAGIIIVTPWFMRRMGGEGDRSTRAGRCARWFRALVAVSAAAGVATAPLVAYHFKFVSGISLAANLVAVPLTGALLSPVVAVASVLVFPLPSAAAILWKFSGVAAALFIWFARETADIGEPLLLRWAPSAFDMSIAYAAIAAILFWRQFKHRRAAAILLVLLIAFDAGYPRLIPFFDRRLKITVLDVGQGDSSLVRFPDGRTMLIDGGGIEGSDFDIGRSVVAPALWRMGIHRIDWVLLTHPHYDHYQGLRSVAGLFRPEVLWTDGHDAPPGEGDSWGSLLSSLKAARVPLATVAEGETRMDVGGATLSLVRIPEMPGMPLNDASIVADIRFGSRRFLFMGDMSKDGERELMQMEPDLAATFLKVGHHGSALSSSTPFLQAVRPKIAAISVGSRNRYGMPSKSALARLHAAGSDIYRTDEDGAITMTTDGEDLRMETYIKR